MEGWHVFILMNNSIKINKLSKTYLSSESGELFYALRDINLDIEKNRITAVIGESGSGKTTIGKVIAGIVEPSEGELDYSVMNFNDDINRRKNIQMVFQDPWTSLDPFWKAKNIILEGVRNFLKPSKDEEENTLNKWLSVCGFKDTDKDKYPHQFSGGQRQRLAIARSLALSPDFLICDEILSALDASVKGRLLNILYDEFKGRDKTMLFIAHDLDIVRMIADRIVVMIRGRIAEEIPRVNNKFIPRHPYSAALFDAVPVMGKKLSVEDNKRKNLLSDNSICPYGAICQRKVKECELKFPEITDLPDNHRLFCYNPKESL